jgi:hypothetical protein
MFSMVIIWLKFRSFFMPHPLQEYICFVFYSVLKADLLKTQLSSISQISESPVLIQQILNKIFKIAIYMIELNLTSLFI